MKKSIFLFFSLLLSVPFYGQVSPLDGIKDEPGKTYAFIHAKIHINPSEIIEDATLLIEDGKIKEVGKNVKVPEKIPVIDCSGLHIYPSFIELHSSTGMPEPKRNSYRTPQYESSKQGAFYWNEAIKPETSGSNLFNANYDQHKELRKYGFGTVLSHVDDGISQGTGVIITLNNEEETKIVLKQYGSQHFSFSKGVSGQEYPSSLTGSIALIRQFFYDADWYEKMKGKAELNLSIEAYLKNKSLPSFFKVRDKLELFRAQKIASEFGLKFIYIGNGDEYQVAKSINFPLVIPVTFPSAYNVSDPLDADMVSLADMKHWETAPANPGILEKNKISFAITSYGSQSSGEFWENIKKACKYGLSKEKLLASLTTEPAKLIGIEDKIGTLEKGKLANFLITESEPGDKDFLILENWVQGSQFIINDKKDFPDVRGTYEILAPAFDFIHTKKITIEGSKLKPNGKFHYSDTTKLSLEINHEKDFIQIKFFSKGQEGYIRFTGYVLPDKSIKGYVETPKGIQFEFNALYKEEFKEKENDKIDSLITPEIGTIWYPNMAYGWNETEINSTPKSFLIKNATVWTNEKEGILSGYDVLINNGKIVKVAKGIEDKNAFIIDGTGKHLTAGIIDEHSHIALKRGVNEGTQSSSAEVRMGDVVNNEDINIYRQLAGGVTMAQLLHGSANTIGGQSAIIKLRWGSLPDEMLMKNAPGFIKFALGENVKQSNWGSNYSIRYPQTRMGVEQFIYEMFNRAKEYERKKKESKDPVRKDLELETLLEILESKRFISCHSYVQSEINMLMHAADSLGFKVNTFTHILEGYKVADKMKKHGANASTFADWWAYKMEVMEAIPYNGAILSKVGVNTAVNSDDAEMARRLNQEAAKLIKYGGLSQEEAWKTVTLNPAKMLHIDQWVGSIKEGKDADLVLWGDNPLSIYAKALTTWVDGVMMYDEKRDEMLRNRIKEEKTRLVQKMLKAIQDGEPSVPVNKEQQILYHCDDMGEGVYHLIQLFNEN